MSTPISALHGHLSTRSYNAVFRNFTTVEDVYGASDAELLAMRSIGPLSVTEIRQVVSGVLNRPVPEPVVLPPNVTLYADEVMRVVSVVNRLATVAELGGHDTLAREARAEIRALFGQEQP